MGRPSPPREPVPAGHSQAAAHRVPAILAALAAGLLALPRGSQPAPAAAVRAPVVFVPGLTGTQLEDPRDGSVIWGGAAQLLRPHDGGRLLTLPLDPRAAGEAASAGREGLHPQALYEPTGPLWEMRIPGWTKPIYRPLREELERTGYRLGRLESPAAGETLFFFNYDWRRGNLESVARLARQLTALAAATPGRLEVDLVCQSNAARICRYLVKYGALGLAEAEDGRAPELPFAVRKVVLVGASNGGAVRALEQLTRGRRYVPVIGRHLQPEVSFSLRPLFEDLPAPADPVFVDSRGRPLAVDLYEARNWQRYGWSIFDPESRRRLAAAPRPDLFGDEELQLSYLARRLDTARRLHRLLARDAPHFPAVRYYRLENRSAATMQAALLEPAGAGWRTFFAPDRRVARDRALRALAAAPGDGHATLESQRRLSPQEEAASQGTYLATGGHFEMVIAPESLRALLAFLGD
ncbi:MAG: hypothetical protein OES32_12945 [Acidobacteriota bacterium]|nr:hypothetical protein [Acidobacteriota bacterium]MDH3524485.1 hypothetical protein [Acidobacteriota bacterium]